jgi:hypothetical protein
MEALAAGSWPVTGGSSAIGDGRLCGVRRHRSWGLIGLVGVAMSVGACSNSDVVEQTSSTSTTEPPSTSTSTLSQTTTLEGRGLDLSAVGWASHGPDGIRLDGGPRIWDTLPFPAGIARDRQGGLVFSDSAGLWWFQTGAVEPEHVREGADEVITVVTTESGPAVLTWAAGLYRLTDGEPVEPPADLPVEVSSEPPWLTWTATNGISGWVTDPVVETDSEGQPSQMVEPAHLIIADGEEVLVDTRIADADQAWATIHDFDGQRLIVSRGPYEPAMPEESFVLIDLSTGELTEILVAGGTRATFTGADADWNGPVVAPDLSN